MGRVLRDEQRSFALVWLVAAGGFGGVSVWAVYDDFVTRSPWANDQAHFFAVERDLAAKNLASQRLAFAQKGQKRFDELEREKQELLRRQQRADYRQALSEIAQLDRAYQDAEQDKTFAKSDLDETYYLRTLAEYARDDKIVAALAALPRDSAVATDLRAPAVPIVRQENESAAMAALRTEAERIEARGRIVARALQDARLATAHAPIEELKDADQRTLRLFERERDLGHAVEEAERRMAQAQERKRVIGQRTQPVVERLTAIEQAQKILRRPIEDAELRVNTAEDLGPEILQAVTYWRTVAPRRTELREDVDRCQSCHRGVDSGLYTDPSVAREFRSHPARDPLLAAHPADRFGCSPCHQGQGRATERTFAHSRAAPLLEPDGQGGAEVAWHREGDHYWEEPMLQVGQLHDVVLPEDAQELRVTVGTRSLPPIRLPAGAAVRRVTQGGRAVEEPVPYTTTAQILARIQSAVQERIDGEGGQNRDVKIARPAGVEPGPGGDRSYHYYDAFVADYFGSRVRFEVQRLPIGGAPPAPPPRLAITWTSAKLRVLLGFRDNLSGVSSYTAPLPPDPTELLREDVARGVVARRIALDDGSVLPVAAGSGFSGMQVPRDHRATLILSAPMAESSCLKCHASDTDLRPRRSVAEAVIRNATLQIDAAHQRSAREAARARGEPASEPTEPLAIVDVNGREGPESAVDLAPLLSEGRYLFRKLNCTGCHILDGFPGNRDAGPQLNNIADKVGPAWLVNWLRYPRQWRRHTRMPNFWPWPINPATQQPAPADSPEYRQWLRQRSDESEAIAAYLLTQSTPADLRVQTPVAGASADEGRRLFESVGCRGCHLNSEERPGNFAGRERDIAPNLLGIADKTSERWLTNWILDPRHWWPGTRMPNLRLTEREANSVAQYLMTLSNPDPDTRVPPAPASLGDAGRRQALAERGRQLIGNYGCYGCHNIRGFENYAPIAPELTGFARKDVTTLDFGYAITDHHQQTWETFVVWKLDAPRIYRRDRIELRMADFDLTPHEIRSLLVFLKGTVEERIQADLRPENNPRYQALLFGRDLVEDFNCRGCHVIEGSGGDIRTYYSQSSETLVFAPPLLRAQGLKVQPQWFFEFLRNPVPIRRWLDARMPTFPFGDDQAAAIVRYFNAYDGQSFPYEQVEIPPMTAEHFGAAQTLFDRLQCARCHVAGERVPVDLPPSNQAPNLDLVRRRLRPAWVWRWLEDPSRLQPGVIMPAFWMNPDPYGGEGLAFPGLPPSDAQSQIRMIQDYLFNRTQAQVPAAAVGGGPTAAAPRAPARAAARQRPTR